MATHDSNGVAILYSNNGNIQNFGPLQERSGTRADISNPPINCEFTGYFQGGSDDDIAGKIRGANHSDGEECNGCCYIPACRTGGGSRYRTECPHPTGYEDCDAVQENSCQSFGSWKGLKVVVWNTTNNCVHWELWQDQGNSSSAPANQWVRVMHDTDCNGKCSLDACGGGPLLRPRGGTHQMTWRADGGPDSKWMTATELVAGGSSPPPPGGGGTTPPANNPGTGGSGPGTPGTGGSGPGSIPGGNGTPGGNTGEPSPNPGTGGTPGGGGGGNDFNTGTARAFAGGGCAIAVSGSGVTAQAGNCSGNVGGTGDGPIMPGDGGGVGGATEPKPIVTVFKDLTLLYNIRVDLFDNCTISGDANITDFEEIYNVQATAGEYATLFKSSTTMMIGTKLHSSESALYKKKIRKVTVTMKKSTGVALTGNLVMEIRDRNGNIMTEFDTVIDPAVLSLNDEQYEFLHLDNTYECEAGDMILLSYADGGDTTNHVLVATAATGADQFDGFNTVQVESSSGLSYDIDQLNDWAAQIFI